MIRAFQVGEGPGSCSVIVFAETAAAAKALAYQQNPWFNAPYETPTLVAKRFPEADRFRAESLGQYMLGWELEAYRRIYRELGWYTIESGETGCLGCGLYACEIDGCEVCDECHHCGECGCDEDCELRLDT
ncbi:MAG: hypothetical protein V3R83_09900 [Gammaproteobacteria bacterium]